MNNILPSEWCIINYDNIQIFQNCFLLKTEDIKRKWKERWFTRPRYPFVKTRSVQVPDMSIYFIGDNQIVMHPERFKLLQKEIEEHNREGEGNGK